MKCVIAEQFRFFPPAQAKIMREFLRQKIKMPLLGRCRIYYL